ncbi:transmembrane protein 164-like [Amphiura filiformis]|uniref:transmembrane protein 164-like n=1 Tax=Amphiura filiformis TaxID=82378 RepID=UPI003B2119F1
MYFIPSMEYSWKSTFDWVCSGVDPKFAGNGGPECVGFLTPGQRLLETTIILAISILEIVVCWPRLKVPAHVINAEHNRQPDSPGKRFMLVLLSVTFGVELGYKFATKTVIYVLNPCHVISAVQIYLLAAPPSKTTLVVFRMHMTALSGPLLAILLPVLNTRLLPCEPEMYWVQHILIYFVVPPYLMSLGGAYSTESMGNFWWCIFTTGVLFIYHFIPLQGLGLITQVNLNNVICPAPSDPFYHRWYRLLALIHQHLLLPVHLKTYTWIVKKLLPQCPEVCNGDVAKKDT